MKKHAILFLLILSFAGFAQRGNIWYFGLNAGLDFNSGSPVAIFDGQMSHGEGCAVLCDTLGNLMLYTDGMNVWNKNHNLMPNGNATMNGDNSSSQSAIIIQKPGNYDHYYIFTAPLYSDNVNGLEYN